MVAYSILRDKEPRLKPVAQGIQPADELAAQAAGDQVAQQVVGQDTLPAAEHMAQAIQPAAAQVPQQAVGQAQHGELEVEYIYFCCFCVFFYKLRAGTRAATLYLSSFLACFRFSRSFIPCALVSLFVVVKLIGNSSVFRVLADFLCVTICWLGYYSFLLFVVVRKLLFMIMKQLEGAVAYRLYLFDISIECQRR